MFIATTGREMLRLAGEIADGVIVNVGVHPPCLAAALEAVKAGAAAVDPPRPTPELVCWLQGCAVQDERRSALNAVKATAALTLANAPDWMLDTMQIDPRWAREMREVYYTKGSSAAAELVSDELVDMFTIAGTPEDAARKTSGVIAQGFDEIIFLPDESAGGIRQSMRTLAEKVISDVPK